MLNDTNKVFYVAEISANHLGSFEKATRLIEAASIAGASAVKFQTYTPDTMTLNIPNFKISKSHSLWGGRNLYDLYQEAMTPWEWHKELFDYAISLNLVPFSTPFDLSAVEFLESINCPLYKISSLETSDLRLIKAVADTYKPIIVSTGATEFSEIEDLVKVVNKSGNKDLTLLICTSAYPADPLDANLNKMRLLQENFDVKVGLSDHTLGIGVSIAAVTLGATVIEKHITLNRSEGGPDAAFSMEPHEFQALVKECNSALYSLGKAEWKIQDSEIESRRLRRSLYVIKSVKAGDFVTHENLRAIRPGGGCSPIFLESFIGKQFIKDVDVGTPMNANLVSD